MANDPIPIIAHAGRISLPPDMEAVLLNPDWTAEQVAAWRYWWPLSEAWP